MDINVLSEFLRLQKSMAELRESQEQSEQSLRSFIQQEFQKLKASILFAAADHESSAADRSIQKSVDTASRAVCIKNSHAAGMAAEPSEAVLRQNFNEAEDSSDHSSHGSIMQEARALEIWHDFQKQVLETFEHNAYKRLTTTLVRDSESLWHQAFRVLGCDNILQKFCKMPTSCVAKLTQHSLFVTFSTLLILSNAAIMGYEVDAGIKAALQNPPGEVPAWIPTCNLVYTVLFTAELLFRIVALRIWFWVSPDDWAWNVFDVGVVMSSLMTEIGGGSKLSFLRTFRILRAVRAVRLIRVLRFFVELRKMFFAIVACMGSLMWCFLFIGMMIFIFSILILQGIVDALNSMEPNSHEHADACYEASQWYGTLGNSMFSLLAIFTAGEDFYTFLKPVSPAGYLYSTAFVIYTIFIIVGVMNVLTGVFLANAEMFADRSLIVHNERMKQETFVQHMMDVFEELDLDRNGVVTWEEFSGALSNDNLQAYLAAKEFQVSHARLVFDVLDVNCTGKVNLIDFVMGMLQVKGEAKAIDAKIIQREIGMLPKLLGPGRSRPSKASK